MTPEFAVVRDQWLSQFEDVTAKNYRLELNLFGSFLVIHRKRFESLGKEQALALAMGDGKLAMINFVESWRVHQQKSGLKRSSIGKRISIVNGFLKYAYYLGAIDYFIETKLRHKKFAAHINGPNIDEMQSLLSSVDEFGLNEYLIARDTAITRLNYDLCLRSKEIFQLDMGDLHFESLNNRYLMTKLKRHDEPIRRAIPPQCYEALVKWVTLRDKFIKRYVVDKKGLKTGPLFLSLTERKFVKRLEQHSWTVRLGQMAKEAGLPRINTQLIRHTAITMAMEMVQSRNMPIESVLAFTGHSDLKSILSYRDGLKRYQAHIAWLVSQELTNSP